jgi:ketosteroid isomerase-like protein
MKGKDSMNTVDIQQRLQDLHNHIRQGKIIEALNEFYDRDAVMQDNANPPTKGLAANIEREKQFMSAVKEWKGFTVTALGAGDNVTFYESVVDFVTTDGTHNHLEQVSVAKWKNGKIVHERFYYDTAKK